VKYWTLPAAVSLAILITAFSEPHLSAASTFGNPLPDFREQTIATGLNGGYQVVIADINHDGKPDIIALASGLKELSWYENPTWQKHVFTTEISRPINCAAWDVDGDGIPEIAVAFEFSNNPAQSTGIVSLLKHKGDPRQPWDLTEIDRIPTSHRLRWADIEGSGKKVLINAPLVGATAKAPDYWEPVSLVMYRPGSWKREVISEELQGVLHGILITDWNNDKRDDVLTASFLGVDCFTFGRDKKWKRTSLVNGDPSPWPKSGASDIAVGSLARERFFSTIEPWHGNQVAIYRKQNNKWQRNVIETGLNDGHVLVSADLNNDGRDEVIAGYRGQGRSVYIYSADGPNGAHWTKKVLDDGGMGAAGCAAADLNGDKRLDVVCIGTATANLKLYENLGRSLRDHSPRSPK